MLAFVFFGRRAETNDVRFCLANGHFRALEVYVANGRCSHQGFHRAGWGEILDYGGKSYDSVSFLEIVFVFEFVFFFEIVCRF